MTEERFTAGSSRCSSSGCFYKYTIKSSRLSKSIKTTESEETRSKIFHDPERKKELFNLKDSLVFSLQMFPGEISERSSSSPTWQQMCLQVEARHRILQVSLRTRHWRVSFQNDTNTMWEFYLLSAPRWKQITSCRTSVFVFVENERTCGDFKSSAAARRRPNLKKNAAKGLKISQFLIFCLSWFLQLHLNSHQTFKKDLETSSPVKPAAPEKCA